MYQLLLPIVFAASVLAAPPVALPSNFKKCKNAPDRNTCLRPAIQSAIADLVNGSKALGVLPIDPLQLSSLGINQDSGPVAISLDFKDVQILGLSKVVIESVDAQLNGDVKTLELTVSTENTLSLVGKYTINGKVLILPISGTGDSRIDLFGVTASITFTGKTVAKEGIEYLVFNSVRFNLKPNGAKLKFDNLFNGDKTLGDNMNKFLNENWEPIYGELKDQIQKAFAAAFIAIANHIFTKVPFAAIFPQ